MRMPFRHAYAIFEDELSTGQTADRQQEHGEQRQRSCLLSVPYRKALPNTRRAFQFVDHRDGVVLN
jgi:hypothetical protein